MNGYAAFLKKEFTENLKNFRFLILFSVFLIFGLISPYLAKFLPELLSAAAPDMQMGVEPAALDAWKQFYRNSSGVGFSAFIILFGGCMSGEYSTGALVLMLTKGLTRSAVILAKYTAAAVFMTVSYWTGFLAACCQTAFLWPETTLSHVFAAAFFPWLTGFLYLSILLLGSVVCRQTFTCILFTGGIAAVLSLTGIAGPLAAFSPLRLSYENVDLISGAVTLSEFIIPAVISTLIAITTLLTAIRVFDRKQF